MKAKVWVTFERECNVDVSTEEFLAGIHDSDDFLRVINCAAEVFRGVTDDQIATLNEPRRMVISDYLTRQAARFKVTP